MREGDFLEIGVKREADQLEAVLAELLGDEQCPEEREPDTPPHHLVHLLHIQHPKHKDEFVEHKVPEFVSHVLWGERERERERGWGLGKMTEEDLTHLLLH